MYPPASPSALLRLQDFLEAAADRETHLLQGGFSSSNSPNFSTPAKPLRSSAFSSPVSSSQPEKSSTRLLPAALKVRGTPVSLSKYAVKTGSPTATASCSKYPVTPTSWSRLLFTSFSMARTSTATRSTSPNSAEYSSIACASGRAKYAGQP